MHGNNGNNMNDNNSMESSFYEENLLANNGPKRPLTLDLNSKQQAKKPRLNISPTTVPIDSPDLQMLKFTTPDLEKIIFPNTNLPTPNLVFPTKVTSEQEDYAKGFVDALNSLRNNENSQSQSTNSMSGGSITYTNLDESFPVAIKDEPQTVPNSPPMSPIDMETQERIKLERKRQRNRVAASKCRKRKLERISKLEDKVKILKGENSDLASVIKQLKEHVFQLKQQVIDHINAGCNVSLYNSAVLQVK